MNIRCDGIRSLVTFILAPVLLISFLLEPFTPDLIIMLGTAKITAKIGSFPANIDAIWEIKFIGNRILFYILNWADPFQGLLYQIWMKGMVAVVAIVILWLFSKEVGAMWGVERDWVFILGFIGVFAIGSFMIMQAEWFAVLICLGMITLLLRNSNATWVAAGALVIPLLLMKGTTVLLAPVALLAYIIIMGKRGVGYRMPWASLGIAIATGAFAVAWWLWFPHLLQDSILSVAVAHPASLSLLASLEFLIYFGICVIGFAPFIIVSGAGGFLAVAHSTKKDLYELGILLSMWLIPLIGVIAQSDFYY